MAFPRAFGWFSNGLRIASWRSCKRRAGLSPGMSVHWYNYKLALLLCTKLFEDINVFHSQEELETTFLAILCRKMWKKEKNKIKIEEKSDTRVTPNIVVSVNIRLI